MKKNKINWEKVIKYGVALGYMASMLYLMLILTAHVTAQEVKNDREVKNTQFRRNKRKVQ